MQGGTYFPTKKLFIIALPVIVLAGVFVLFHSKSSAPQKVESGLVAIKNSDLQEQSGSWRSDWQEIIGSSTINSNVLQFEPTDNPTDRLSKQIFTEYVALKQSDAVNPYNIDELASRIAQGYSATDEPDQYSLKDIKIINDSDIATKQYLAVLEQILSTYSSDFKNFINGQKGTADENLDKNFTKGAAMYSKLSLELLSLPVPNSLSKNHLTLINTYSKMSKNLLAALNMNADPLTAVNSLSQYAKNQNIEASVLAEIRTNKQ